MTRVYLRFVLLPVVLLTAVLILIHAQPYDDRQLQELLTPENCPAPCFMGIRPGVTTSKEALAILQRHEWVDAISVINNDNPYQIWWTWSENAPDILKSPPDNPDYPAQGEVYSSGEIVSNIGFTPKWMLGDIVLTLGIPPETQIIIGGMVITPDSSIVANTALAYQAQGFWASARTRCPFNSNLWHSSARLRITNQFDGISTGAVYAINQKAFLVNVRETSTRMCGV